MAISKTPPPRRQEKAAGLSSGRRHPYGAKKGAAGLQRASEALLALRAELDGQPQPDRQQPPDSAPAAAECSAVDSVPSSSSGPSSAPSSSSGPSSAPSSSSGPSSAPSARAALTSNPRKLRYWRSRVDQATKQLRFANEHAIKGRAHRLVVPREVYQAMHGICDETAALAGALDWVRRMRGPAVALEVEAAGLYRVRGGVQIDDWSCARARRKVAILTLFLMSPIEATRSEATGSTSTELVLLTCGIPQTLLLKLIRSEQREPYSVRTLQRDLAEIDECTDLLLRWRTPAVHAQSWERSSEHGVINRYCVRAGLIRDQWRRSRSSAEAAVKELMLRMASWLVWNPAPARGSHVPLGAGGLMTTLPS